MSGNGVDLASIYQLLAQVAQTVTRHDRSLDELDRKMGDLNGKVDDVDYKVDGLRQAVTQYHASVLGHGILISELDARLRRVEQHLNLPPAA